MSATKSNERCGMSWPICSHNGALVDAESRRMARNGAKRAATWESRTNRVVTIYRSQRKFTRPATFIVAQIAKKNFPAFDGLDAQSRAWLAAENTTEENSIRGFD